RQVAAGGGGDDRLRAAELLERLAGVGRGRVDVVVRAELAGQRLLGRAARDRGDPQAHLGRVLDAEVTQAADALHRDQVPGPRLRLEQRVEGGEPRAQQRGRLDGGQ